MNAWVACIRALWIILLLFEAIIMGKAGRFLLQKLRNKDKRVNAAITTTIFIFLAMLSSLSFSFFAIYAPFVVRESWEVIWFTSSQSVFGFCTIAHLLNVSLLWIELCDDRNKTFISQANITRTKYILVSFGSGYVAMCCYLLASKKNGYSGILNFIFMAILTFVFRTASTRLSKKLENTSTAAQQRSTCVARSGSEAMKVVLCAKNVSMCGFLFCLVSVVYALSVFLIPIPVLQDFLGFLMMFFGVFISFLILRYLAGETKRDGRAYVVQSWKNRRQAVLPVSTSPPQDL